jgi:hypothetical protein
VVRSDHRVLHVCARWSSGSTSGNHGENSLRDPNRVGGLFCQISNCAIHRYLVFGNSTTLYSTIGFDVARLDLVYNSSQERLRKASVMCQIMTEEMVADPRG